MVRNHQGGGFPGVGRNSPKPFILYPSHDVILLFNGSHLTRSEVNRNSHMEKTNTGIYQEMPA